MIRNTDPVVLRWLDDGPDALLAVLEAANLPDADLTYAAECCQNVEDSQAVRRVLVPLLSHPSPLVREGAIYGLSNHMDDAVIGRLRTVADTDASAGVREVAAGTISEE